MSSKVCKHCGSSDIDVDQARGDAVCMGCGSVLEDNIIVSEVEFVESGGGGSLAVGQFVSSEAKLHINTLGHQLQMSQHCLDTAFNFYKMALNKSLTRGRKAAHVMAACLYLVCRTEGTPHMLLDLSDILQVNVYVLGRTFLLLTKELCINAPAIALLVAAHLHDFRRTVKEIVNVVKVCETTLRKRLVEFEDTPASQLTVEEFMRVDLDQECDPPCFIAGLKKKKAKELELALKKKMDDLEGEIQVYRDEIDAELEQCRPKLRGVYAAYTKEECLNEDLNSTMMEESDESDELQAVAKHFGRDLNELTLEALIKLEKEGSEEEENQQEIPKRKGPSLASILGRVSSTATLGLSESIDHCVADNIENDGTDDSGELDLCGIDDSEINLYLLNDEEVQLKTALWMAENSDYLKEQKEKEAKIKKEKELGIYKPKRGPSKKRTAIRANTADEAIEKMLEQKKISNKINYDVLKDLDIKPGTSPASVAGSLKLKQTTSNAAGSNRRPAPSRATLSLSMPLSSLGKRLQPFISRQPNKKLAVEQAEVLSPPSVTAAAPPSGVVVESGPVSYDDVDDEEEEEEETCVSAMELLGGEGYGCDGEYDDGY